MAKSLTAWNLSIGRDVDGAKRLSIQLHGVIDGSWFDDDVVKTADVCNDLQAHPDAANVDVHINSVGGSAFGGIAMYNALKAHPGVVTCYVDGLAASAASLVAMAGKTVMGRGAMMMIHSPMAGIFGNSTELRKTADWLDKVQGSLASIYTEKTGKSAAALEKLLIAETWMTADETVAAGFADEIAGEEREQPQMTSRGLSWAGVTFPRASLPSQIIAMATAAPPKKKGNPTMSIKDAKCDGCSREMDDDDDLYCAACHGSVDAKALLSMIGVKSMAEAVALVTALKISADEVTTLKKQLAEQAMAAESQAFDVAITSAKNAGLLAPSDEHKRNKAALAFKSQPNAVANLKVFLAALDPLVPSSSAAAHSTGEPTAGQSTETAVSPAMPAPQSGAALALTPKELKVAHRMGVNPADAVKNKARLLALSAQPDDDDGDDDEDAA